MKLSLFFSLILFSHLIMSQEISKNRYNRSSISWIIVNRDKDENFELVNQSFQKVKHSEKFFYNPLNTLLIDVDKSSENKEKLLLNYINQSNFGNQILKTWHPLDSTGTFSQLEIINRALYNATDDDVIRSKYMHRGLAYIQDYGYNLIEKSYIIVLDFRSVTTLDRKSLLERIKLAAKGDFSYLLINDYRGYIATVDAYLYQLNYSENNKTYFNEKCWINNEDNAEVRNEKMEAFNNLNPNFQFSGKTTCKVSVIKSVPKGIYRLFRKDPTWEDIMDKLIKKTYDEVVEELAVINNDLRVATPLFDDKPIKAKIGTKEGIRMDDRFDVYEYSDVSNGKISNKPIASVRVSKVAKNAKIASGNSKPSRFYQTYGSRIEPGHLLIERKDRSFSIQTGYRFGNIKGMMYGFEFLLSKSFRLPISGISLGFNYTYNAFKTNTMPYEPAEKKYKHERSELYLAKSFSIAYGIMLRPMVGTHSDQLSFKGEKYGFYSANGYFGGLELNYSFSPILKVYANSKYLMYKADEDETRYSDYTKGGLNFGVGLRLGFTKK